MSIYIINIFLVSLSSNTLVCTNEFWVTLLQEYAVQNLLLYYDSDTQWPAVYKTSKVRASGIAESCSIHILCWEIAGLACGHFILKWLKVLLVLRCGWALDT